MTTLQQLVALRDSVATKSIEWRILQRAVDDFETLERIERKVRNGYLL